MSYPTSARALAACFVLMATGCASTIVIPEVDSEPPSLSIQVLQGGRGVYLDEDDSRDVELDLKPSRPVVVVVHATDAGGVEAIQLLLLPFRGTVDHLVPSTLAVTTPPEGTRVRLDGDRLAPMDEQFLSFEIQPPFPDQFGVRCASMDFGGRARARNRTDLPLIVLRFFPTP